MGFRERFREMAAKHQAREARKRAVSAAREAGQVRALLQALAEVGSLKPKKSKAPDTKPCSCRVTDRDVFICASCLRVHSPAASTAGSV